MNDLTEKTKPKIKIKEKIQDYEKAPHEYQKQEPRSKLIRDDTRLHDQIQVK